MMDDMCRKKTSSKECVSILYRSLKLILQVLILTASSTVFPTDFDCKICTVLIGGQGSDLQGGGIAAARQGGAVFCPSGGGGPPGGPGGGSGQKF